jgi:hypothetical protein
MSKMNNNEREMMMNGEETAVNNMSGRIYHTGHEVVCPKCGTKFTIDDQNYRDIANQIRNSEFNKAVADRKAEIEKSLEDKMALRISQEKQQMDRVIAEKDKAISDLNMTLVQTRKTANEYIMHERDKARTASSQMSEKMAAMQKELDDRDKVQESAIAEAVAREREKSVEKDALIAQLRQNIEVNEAQTSAAVAKAITEEREKSGGKDIQIASLEKDLENEKKSREMLIKSALADKEKTLAKLTADLAAAEKSKIISEEALKSKYEALIQTQQEEIERYKDFKSHLSVKLIGESLEVHCKNEFEKIRPYMPNAYFEKDNDVSKNGKKGDYILRDYDDDGIEYLSIMFEMKNESDDSEHKHKNEDFFAKLDQDRTVKGCKYAVLVTVLEPDSELYDRGIVDVSHRYKNMYVIRPQFFIPMITILRSAALDTAAFRHEVEKLKEENIDVSTFEQDLQEYKDAVSRSHELAGKKKNSAIDKIDRAIKLLNQIKADFEGFDKHMAEADNKAQKVTIRTLTKDAPSVLGMLDDRKNTEVRKTGGTKPDLLPAVEDNNPAA